jgi:hypothetical protein
MYYGSPGQATHFGLEVGQLDCTVGRLVPSQVDKLVVQTGSVWRIFGTKRERESNILRRSSGRGSESSRRNSSGLPVITCIQIAYIFRQFGRLGDCSIMVTDCCRHGAIGVADATGVG